MEIVNIILSSMLQVISPQINVRLVVVVLAGCIGASVGLVFMWWGIRKMIHVMMTAFRSGALSVSGSGDIKPRTQSEEDSWHSYDGWVQDRLDFLRDMHDRGVL